MKTMTRAQFNALKGTKQAPIQAVPQGVKTMSRADFNASKGGVKTMSRAEFNAKTTPQQSGAFNWTMNQLIKPVSMASNLLEDTGKSIGYGVAKLAGAKGNADKLGIDFIGHQLDVLKGKNKRTYSDIMNEAGDQQSNPLLKYGQKTIGYGGDFMLDPLNKVSVLGKTAKGLEALKVGELGLSAAEQAQKGERALLQLGKYNILPSVGNKVLEGATKLNDAIRGTKVGSKVMDIGAELSSKIRPGAVSREDFKILSDAKSAARNTLGYTQDKAIEFAKNLAKDLKKSGATDAQRAYLLHAIEKGNATQVPKGLEAIYKQGVEFKTANEDLWKQLGGSTLEGHGLSHVATDAVAEQARKDAFKGQGGFKLTSTQTPQDIHRQWVKVGELPKSQPLQEGVAKTNPLIQEAKPIYHGTPEKFTKFDTNRMEGGAAWFTADKKEILSGQAGAVQGAGQKLNVMERYVKPNVKLATREMEDKLTTDQLIAEGYRGVKYPAETAKGYESAEWTKLWFPNEDTVTKMPKSQPLQEARAGEVFNSDILSKAHQNNNQIYVRDLITKNTPEVYKKSGDIPINFTYSNKPSAGGQPFLARLGADPQTGRANIEINRYYPYKNDTPAVLQKTIAHELEHATDFNANPEKFLSYGKQSKKFSEYKSDPREITANKSQHLQEGGPLIQEAKKYATPEEFVKNQPVVYHGSPEPLKSFHNKNGAFFTDTYEDATGFAGTPDNTYEGHLNFKNPLVIDAKGAKWNELNTKYGTSTQEVITNAQKDGYDGVTFKNIVDNAMDTAGAGGESTIHYAYKPKDAFLNEDQLKELWKKSNKSQSLQEGVSPLIQEARIANLGDEGIKFKNGKYFNKVGKEVQVSQASAMEINNARTAQGKAPLFKEDLPIVAAKMGISTGKKQAATDFLKATSGLKGEEAIKLAQETHDKMVNPESLRKAIKMFDSVQNIWKAQALVAPSYHIRNFAGNLWNNFLADVKTPAYAIAGDLQNAMRTGKLSEAQAKLVKEMETHGVIGTGQYGSDIAKTIENGVGKTSINPLSQNFAGYKLNKFIGGGIEDNAKIAHFLSKRAEGYGAKQAAESVKKYLFDYGDLTSTEKGLLKRVMPFYTWTSKNIPLQVQQFVENPGKFSKIATAKKDVEQGVAQPNEKYMSDYLAGNAPIRVKKDANGNTLYFLAGAWLPAAQAITFLSDPVSNALGMVTPAVKLPYENLTGKGTFFKDTLGQYEDIQKYPGQKTSYLGLDMNPQTVNNLRSIRPLNELNNLNPFGMFGTQNSPSMLKGILPNASNVRGGQFSPQTSQSDRVANAFVGKLQGYNPEDSQKYYDRDTQGKVTEFKTAIDRAISNDQVDLAKGLIKQMSEFVQSRDGKPNKDMQMYNLLGDKYFQDMAQNKQAEKQRGYIRDDMKKQIRQGLASNDTNLIMEALKKDPTYAQQALKDAIMEQQTQSDEQQKLLYQINQAKTQKRLNPFYSK